MGGIDINSILGLAGTLFGGYMSAQSAKGMAQDQRDFERSMSNTSYQRAVIDMERAGLNPAMMFGKGGPESTPSVAVIVTGKRS